MTTIYCVYPSYRNDGEGPPVQCFRSRDEAHELASVVNAYLNAKPNCKGILLHTPEWAEYVRLRDEWEAAAPYDWITADEYCVCEVELL